MHLVAACSLRVKVTSNLRRVHLYLINSRSLNENRIYLRYVQSLPKISRGSLNSNNREKLMSNTEKVLEIKDPLNIKYTLLKLRIGILLGNFAP